jgi:hypothetical protein
MKIRSFIFYTFFDVEINQGTKARFRRNRWTGELWVFQWNCAERGNEWHSPGYGWGRWQSLKG